MSDERSEGGIVAGGGAPAAGAEAPGGPDDGRFADNVVLFARLLRRAGVPVGPAAVVDGVEAVRAAGVGSREDLYWTLHAVFVSKREHRPVFDEAFRTYWRSRGLVQKMIGMLSPVAPPRPPTEPPKAGQSRVADALFGQAAADRVVERPEVEIDARFTVSEREILQRKDFAQMSAAEIARAKQAIRSLALPDDRVTTRRRTPAPRGREVDLRRTIRASLRSGGAIIPLAFRKRREVHPPIVALVDISGSMSQYSRLFLHFLHALSERRRVATFLFGTRLTNVTRMLRMRDPDEALAACSSEVKDWSGGTRIGEALRLFNKDWSRRMMAGGPVVLLITDGLEREGTEGLAHETDRLRRSCRRLVWLNPLLRFDGFEARAAGVRAMLPHVDEFRSVHSLEAVADLCTALGSSAARVPEEAHDPRRWLGAVGSWQSAVGSRQSAVGSRASVRGDWRSGCDFWPPLQRVRTCLPHPGRHGPRRRTTHAFVFACFSPLPHLRRTARVLRLRGG